MRPAPLLAALLFAGVLPPAGAEGADAPTESRMRLDLETLEKGRLEGVDVWRDDAARRTMVSLDRAWGNGDGWLAPAEADAAERALERSLQGRRLETVRIDGAPALVRGVVASYVVAEGLLELHVDMSLVLSPGPGGHALTLDPRWPTLVVVMPPEGWHARTLDGEDGTVVRADGEEPAVLYLLPAGVPTIELQAPSAGRLDLRAAVMGASAAGLLGIVVFAAVRRRVAF